MLPRNTRSAIMACALLLVTSFAFAANAYKPSGEYQRKGDFTVVGRATGIDSSAEVFDLSGRGESYRILGDRATIQLNNGKYGTLRDLKNDAKVKIVGERLSARTILASTVTVMDDSGSYLGSGDESFRPNDYVETNGYVTRVESHRQEINIRTKSGSYVVLIRPDTVIRRYLYVTDARDIDEGDDINIAGTVDREGRIAAERIQISFAGADNHVKFPAGVSYRPIRDEAVSDTVQDTIEGTVTFPVSAFDRTLGLDTRYGERIVDVPKDAKVLIDSKPGSIHDIKKGDTIRVVGLWSGSTMVALRVETVDQVDLSTQPEEQTPAAQPTQQPTPAPVSNPPANPPAAEAPKSNSLTGRIIAIDYSKFEMTVDAGMQDNKIDASDAAVTRSGSTRRFSELKKGDKVEVKGDWNGDVMRATMVDVVE